MPRREEAARHVRDSCQTTAPKNNRRTNNRRQKIIFKILKIIYIPMEIIIKIAKTQDMNVKLLESCVINPAFF